MYELRHILNNRAWTRRSLPFPHVVARNIFVPSFYDALSTQINNILRLGLSETPSHRQFSRNIPGYDSYGIGLAHGGNAPTAIFLSPAWRDMICAIFGIGITPYMIAGAHHHTVGSTSGFIHNDFNPVWFPSNTGEVIQTPRNDTCSYKTGSGRLTDSEKICVVRGAALLFYLNNERWSHGDGGETGIYSNPKSNIVKPMAACPPINNSLLAFECTPNSYHAFITNKKSTRTSIIMWVHRTMDEAVQRFGSEQLERWKS